MIACYKCTKFKSVSVCGRCRQEVKFDMVCLLLAQDPIYLSESNRNKMGRPSTQVTDPNLIQEIIDAYAQYSSYRKVAELYSLTKNQVAYVIKHHVNSS